MLIGRKLKWDWCKSETPLAENGNEDSFSIRRGEHLNFTVGINNKVSIIEVRLNLAHSCNLYEIIKFLTDSYLKVVPWVWIYDKTYQCTTEVPNLFGF